MRELKKELRGVKTKVERSIRRIDRILRRATKVPELSDLDDLTVEFMEAQREFDEYHNSINAAMQAFVLL